MPKDLAFGDLFSQICAEWDEAEKDLKNAEQVCGEVVIPAIKELRYAGRRLAQALQLASGSGDQDEIRKLLQDACFDCHRARHDAIDAATAQITRVFDIATDKLGYDVVLVTYPNFAVLMTKLEALRAKIVNSRGSSQDRDAIYETIEHSDFPALISGYREFRSFEPIMQKMAKKRRFFNTVTVVLAVIAIFIGIIDFVFHLLK